LLFHHARPRVRDAAGMGSKRPLPFRDEHAAGFDFIGAQRAIQKRVADQSVAKPTRVAQCSFALDRESPLLDTQDAHRNFL
jgi:hypothetical protein